MVSSISSLIKHRNNWLYDAIGASGATSAITFTFILFCPWEKIYFFGILPIPAIIFGAIFLVYCYIMGKRGRDNIGHDAHFWGAIYGFLFPILLKPTLLKQFFSQLF
jgi:membrane associated rhomboid family serine protease